MLGKLIKYDLFYNWRLFVGLMAAMLIWGAAGRDVERGVTGLPFVMVMLPLLFAAGVLCVVSVLRNYARSLYGRQGYLTMTLPAAPGAVLSAKYVTTFLWFNAVILAGALAVSLYFREMDWITDRLADVGGWTGSLLYMNLSMLLTLSNAYLAITVANVSLGGRRLGTAGGIAAYIVWAGAQSLVQRLLLLGHVEELIGRAAEFSLGNWRLCLFMLVCAALGFTANLLLMRKKVNLQ